MVQPNMDVAGKFLEEIKRNLPGLDEDNWHLAPVRQSIISSLEPHEAFASISNIMELALQQEDGRIFTPFCMLALQLAKKSGTTEIPEDVPGLLKELEEHAKKINEYNVRQVKDLASWYRL